MYWPAALGAIDAISAMESTTVNIPIMTARKIQMTPVSHQFLI